MLCVAAPAMAATDINRFIETMNKSDNSSVLASKKSTENADMQRIEQYLNSISTLIADFTQIAPDGEESGGTFFLSRPGKLRWQYNPPVPILIVANGNQLSYYDYELKQLSHTSPSSSLAGFLTRKVIRFADDIIVENLRQDSGLLRIIISQKDHKDQGKLMMIFNNNPIFLKKMTVIDSVGQQTSISLSNIKQGMALEDKLFVIQDAKIFNSH